QVRAAHPACLDVDLVVGSVHGGAQPGEAAVVEVEVAAAEVAAADALDHGFPQPVQQRGHEQHRAAEPPRDLSGQDRAGQPGRVHHEGALRLVELDHGTDG